MNPVFTSFRMVLAKDLKRLPFGRLLIDGRSIELGRAKPALPLAAYMGQLALCLSDSHATPAIRFSGDSSYGGRLYRAFSMTTWPKWAEGLEALRSEGQWPPWRLDRGWLRHKGVVPIKVVGVSRTEDQWLGWSDEEQIDGVELWDTISELVTTMGWTVGDLDEHLRTKYMTSSATLVDDAPVVQPKFGLQPKSEDGVGGSFADLAGVFASRTEFMAAYSVYDLFKNASSVRMAGLSLNMLCQQYADHQLSRWIEEGLSISCYFLDPQGSSIAAREREEGYEPGRLSGLTSLNIETLIRLRGELDSEAQARLSIALYDETIRFNITLVDDDVCIAQPYLPAMRGVQSPTFVFRYKGESGLYNTFLSTFEWIRDRSHEI